MKSTSRLQTWSYRCVPSRLLDIYTSASHRHLQSVEPSTAFRDFIKTVYPFPVSHLCEHHQHPSVQVTPLEPILDLSCDLDFHHWGQSRPSVSSPQNSALFPSPSSGWPNSSSSYFLWAMVPSSSFKLFHTIIRSIFLKQKLNYAFPLAHVWIHAHDVY